jgi:GABA(A) receptor-associated protein
MYRSTTTVDERRATCTKLRVAHPNHVPAIVERGDTDTPAMSREKFLLPKDMTVGQLHVTVRKRARIRADEALFVLCAGRLPPASTTVLELQRAHASEEDGFLYFTYAQERAFG